VVDVGTERVNAEGGVDPEEPVAVDWTGPLETIYELRETKSA